MKVIIPLEIPDGGDVFFHLIKNVFHLTDSLFEIASCLLVGRASLKMTNLNIKEHLNIYSTG